MAKQPDRQPRPPRQRRDKLTPVAADPGVRPAPRSDRGSAVISFRVNAEELAQLEELRQRLRLDSVNITARAVLQGSLTPSARLLDVSGQLERMAEAIEGAGEFRRASGGLDEHTRLQFARAFATLFVNLSGPATPSVDPSARDAQAVRLDKARRAFRQCFDLTV